MCFLSLTLESRENSLCLRRGQRTGETKDVALVRGQHHGARDHRGQRLERFFKRFIFSSFVLTRPSWTSRGEWSRSAGDEITVLVLHKAVHGTDATRVLYECIDR